MFQRVGIPEAEKRYDCYPHELSGGLRQRVMIAMAMVCKPKLLIADEPTTALDVTIEAQILRLMKELRDETGMSVLIITHNMGVVAEICDYVYVMYAGKIMEQAETFELFDHTMHPYTKGLLDSIPRIGQNAERLHTIPVWCPTCCTCRRAARSATAANMPPTNAARKKRSCIPLHRIIRCAASAVRRNINERGKTRSSFAGKRYL